MSNLTHDQIADLVVKVQQGDDASFAALYTATVDRQLYFATSFLRDMTLAEDVVQEVYIKVFNNIHKLENPKVFIAYLNRVCYNTCVDFKKKFYMKKFELTDESFVTIEDEDTHHLPQESLELKQLNNDLFNAIDSLNEQERAAFLLRHYDDFKIKEISDIMGVSESTVKRAIRSAIEKLRTLLEDYQIPKEEEGGENNVGEYR